MVNEEASDFRRVVGVVARNKVATFRQFVRDNEDGVEASRCTGQVYDEVCRNYVPSGGRDGQGLEMAGGTLGIGLVPLTTRAGTGESQRIRAQPSPVVATGDGLGQSGPPPMARAWVVVVSRENGRAEGGVVRDTEAQSLTIPKVDPPVGGDVTIVQHPLIECVADGAEKLVVGIQWCRVVGQRW